MSSFEEGALATPNQSIEDRNAWLEAQLNPEGSLPNADINVLSFDMKHCPNGVLIDPSLDPRSKLYSGNAGSIYVLEPGTESIVADLVYNTDETEPGKMIAINVSALKEERGKGYGKKLYLEALKALPEGFGLISHSMLSADGTRMWSWLVQHGVARLRETPPHGQIGKYETVF